MSWLVFVLRPSLSALSFHSKPRTCPQLEELRCPVPAGSPDAGKAFPWVPGALRGHMTHWGESMSPTSRAAAAKLLTKSLVPARVPYTLV